MDPGSSITTHATPGALKPRHHRHLHRHGRRSPPFDSQHRRRPRAPRGHHCTRCELLCCFPLSVLSFAHRSCHFADDRSSLPPAMLPSRPWLVSVASEHGFELVRLTGSPCAAQLVQNPTKASRPLPPELWRRRELRFGEPRRSRSLPPTPSDAGEPGLRSGALSRRLHRL